MKVIAISLALFIFGLHAFSQGSDSLESKTNKKLTKEQKLEKRKAEAEATAKMVDLMVNQRRFVVEADYIGFHTGKRFLVNSGLNFIKLDSSAIVIQVAPLMGGGGANGLGGITAEGFVSDWKIKRYGKSPQNYSINLFIKATRAGTYDINIIINPNGNAQAIVSGIDAAKVIFYGKVVSLQASKVYKGSSI
jgi:hypothetical protein